MKTYSRLYWIGVLLCITVCLLPGCKKSGSNATFNNVRVADIEAELTNLLEAWYPRIIDTIHGGYWTNFGYDWSLSKKQDKMLVTQSRGLWVASRAAATFPDNPVFRKAADHGYHFLTTCMWDEKNGGFYQNYFTDSSLTVDPSYKLTYGNAFALFALAEYAVINKDPAVLEWVRKTFDWLEKSAHDSLDKGYFNILIPHYLAESGLMLNDVIKRARWGDPQWKDQNTSIHLMEAFTSAYKVLPEEPVRTRLVEMLSLIRDTMVDRAGYLNLFFTDNWIPVSSRDSSHEFILKHPEFDHISFGHNIETAYLLVDASQALYGNPDAKTLSVAKTLIDHTLAHGFDQDYYGLLDKGYVFSSGGRTEIIDSTKTWWAQAEAWHALALFSMLYPDEKVYQEAFANMWTYIQQELIDHRNGGWYNYGLDKNPENRTFQKAHQWKGCYHDGRALFQVVSYAAKKSK